jgi:TPR repeat protein
MKKFLIFMLICISLIANDFNDGIKLYNENNFKDAAIAFTKSANTGDTEAQYILGYLYAGGQGVKHDFKQALYWYKKAASSGHIKAQINLGYMYISAQGTKKNYKEGAYWINKAKKTGNSKAQLLWDEFKLSEHFKEK